MPIREKTDKPDFCADHLPIVSMAIELQKMNNKLEEMTSKEVTEVIKTNLSSQEVA